MNDPKATRQLVESARVNEIRQLVKEEHALNGLDAADLLAHIAHLEAQNVSLLERIAQIAANHGVIGREGWTIEEQKAQRAEHTRLKVLLRHYQRVVTDLLGETRIALEPYAKRQGRTKDWWRGYFDGVLAADCMLAPVFHPDNPLNADFVEAAIAAEQPVHSAS